MPELGTMGEMPEMVIVNGVSGWVFPSGNFYPVIAGGEGDGAGTETKVPAEGAGDKGKKTFSLDGEDFDPERAMATIKKLRDNEKATKPQLKELEDARAKLTAHEQEKMTEAEKATTARTAAEKERDEAKAETRRLKAERAIEKAATKAGLDPELAASLLKADSLELDEAGNPKGIEEALKALLVKWPHLKPETKAGPPNVNATDGKNDKQTQDPKEREAELRQRYRISS